MYFILESKFIVYRFVDDLKEERLFNVMGDRIKVLKDFDSLGDGFKIIRWNLMK